MLKFLKNFMNEEEGNVVEYIIVLAVIVVIIVLIFPGLKTSLKGWYDDMIASVDEML